VPIRDGHGTVIGAAESIDADPWAFDANRRETKLANYGCLDEETGVLSFGYIHTHLRENLITFAEHRMPFSVLCVQIDSMEHFRAAYGAAAVSAVMRVVAQTVESSLRPTDFVGHLAENEFLAILTECNEKELSNSAERLRKTVSNTKFKWWGDDLPVSASFGGATVIEGDDENSVVKRAEKMLAASVKAGGNRVTVAR
jgi:diguanylate cyclase (GGDEF)-like protein